MKVEITVERLKSAKKSAPARWTVLGKRTFAVLGEETEKWAIGLGMPSDFAKAAGWAIRMAVLP